MTASLLPFVGIHANRLKQLIDSSIVDRDSRKDFRKGFTASDWEIAEMLWPHLDGLAELFDLDLQDEGYYMALRWQVDTMGEYISIQSHSGDRYDEGLTVTGNFSSQAERLEVANGIADCLNLRAQERWQMAVLQARLHLAEKETAHLRAALAARPSV